MGDNSGMPGMPSLLVQAAQSAAAADGVLGQQQQQHALQQARNAIAAQQQRAVKPPKKKGPPLRRGKWTPEEEAYAARLIQEFKAGLLPLTDGTTLRTFLSKLLNCDPMRISKKFVGSNCIGKQVFRRRTADLNRLTPEQIQNSRGELSELERRFLERVAQTNRVKSSGVAAATQQPVAMPSNQQQQQQQHQDGDANFTNPPWLQPPNDYRHGQGAAFASSNLSNNRAAAAGRALLQGNNNNDLLAQLQRQASQNSILQSLQRQQQQQQQLPNQQQQQQQQLPDPQQNNNDAFAAAMREGSSSAALQQIARNASAARQLGGGDTNASMNSLMLKTGLSRDQLSQLARDRGLQSSGSLSNMLGRQNSFDALMSLDFQSLQSIDNLANLIQTGGASKVPESGLKNADFGAALSGSHQFGGAGNSGDFSNAQRRLANAASQGRMETLLRNLSGNNVNGGDGNINASNANLSTLIQSMQANQANNNNNSSGNFINNNSGLNQSAKNLADLLRQDSSTGLSALRVQDGLNQRNSSVDDFLSLVAGGDIPHQDASLLNVPLMQQQDAAAKLLAQQQLLSNSNSALANAFRSFNNNSQLPNSASAAALAMAQARAANGSKRSLDDLTGDLARQSSPKH